ncbi:hypothetical protein [Caballeronia choica]|uniref:hypothetical protein n=1 Tax=Caballeronia choica TaxID=326476 RepID=UPI001357B679|nr:hypothetical protein [Caballeronia choica]
MLKNARSAKRKKALRLPTYPPFRFAMFDPLRRLDRDDPATGVLEGDAKSDYGCGWCY